jgi:poly-gamma-glutamate synthesis protein (capsule biosynthesis protein)
MDTGTAQAQETKENIFSTSPKNLVREDLLPQDSTNHTFSLAVVGDLQMGGSALPVIRTKGWDYPFDSTRHIIQSAGLALANLEAPFTNAGIPFDKTFTFRVPTRFARGIAESGFDVLTLANNHILDFGPEGLRSTMNILDSLGIAYCGAGQNIEEAERGVILERGKWRIGFLAYSMTYPTEFWATRSEWGTAYPRHLEKNVRTMKKKADLVVVSFHWGGELKSHPKPYQRRHAHLAIDSGADLVIGHHPHVLQGLEIYRDRLIAYSLGNYVFGSYSQNARDSIILRVLFSEYGLLQAEAIPISVFNPEVLFQPRILRGRDRDNVIRMLNQISSSLNQGKEILQPTGFIELENTPSMRHQ